MMSESEGVRLDQWLWAARFYKTRPLAKAAIENGRVKIAGQRAKPARIIRVGEQIHIDKQGAQIFDVIVLKCESKRAGAKVAQTFYEETKESVARREEISAQNRIAREMVAFPERRPDKNDRRKIRAFRHQELS